MRIFDDAHDTKRGKNLKSAAIALVGAGALLAGTALSPASATPAVPAVAAAEPAAVVTAVTPDFGAQTNATIVASWYATFLGRSAAADPGSAYWVQLLDDGVSPTRVLAFLLQSPEYVTASVAAIYRAYLDSPLDPGAQYWTDGVQHGSFPLEWVEQNVAASPAYLTRTGADRGSGDVAVEGWYSVVLERNPTLGERAYWGSRIDTAGALQAFRELWYAPETVNRRTQLHYQGLLGRSASEGELAYWFPHEVRSDISVIEAIASSPEYAQRAQG